MSMKAFPLLYINMAGEMLYILEQRLKVLMSQEDSERGPRVVRDLVHAIFKKERLEAVFTPGPLPSRQEIRSVFNKLAHVSVMKLTVNSMDKLFDLMIMSCKFQTMTVDFPEQLLTVSVNHLIGMKELCGDNIVSIEHLDQAHAMLYSLFRGTQTWEWIAIRNSLLNFFQGCRVKVSMLMREKRQCDNGEFVLRRADDPINITNDQVPPGKTTYYEHGEETHSTEWPVKREYNHVEIKDTFNLEKDEPRSTLLGGNMYARGGAQALQIKGAGGVCREDMAPNGDEMKFFQQIFSVPAGEDAPQNEEMMDLSLFESEKEEKKYEKDGAEVTKIDASKNKKTLNTAMEEMSLGKEAAPKKAKAKGMDMLDLMDEAANRPPTGKKPVSRGRAASKDSRPVSRAPSSGSTAGARERSASVKTRSTSVARTPSAKPAPSPKSRAGSASRK